MLATCKSKYEGQFSSCEIIGIGCRARVGKDLVARHLNTRYSYKTLAFADSLKAAVRAIFGLTFDQIFGDDKEVVDDFWGRSAREILQIVGTECMRNGYSSDIWVQSAFKHMLDNSDTKKWVIPDVRFSNEAYAIKEWGGKLWRIDRPGIDSVGINGHASEHDLDHYENWDIVFNNDGSISELLTKVDDVMKES